VGRAIAALAASALLAAPCEAAATAGIARDADDIAGVVRGPQGAEAGVWVVAETTGLPTKLARIVVTDDQGRYLLPDLPEARYRIWVRGYGLVDSEPVDAEPGSDLDLAAVPAPDARAAAEYYPANYWLSLLAVPPPNEFPGTGPEGNGIAPAMTHPQQWVKQLKEPCRLCHQLGSKATREIPARNGEFESSTAAWAHRVTIGSYGTWMSTEASRLGPRGLRELAAWTDRVAAGALPPAPPRPAGLERNLVVTLWDWAPSGYVHDEIATDKRDPTVNAGGRVYGVVTDAGKLAWLDPARNRVGEIAVPTRDPKVASTPHNPMLDGKGRVWMTSAFRAVADAPAFCTDRAANPYATGPRSNPVGSPRQLTVLDPKTGRIEMVETCYGTHHLEFDRDDVLYLSGDIEVMGWIDTRLYDKTGDARAAMGWCPMVLDTNGDGSRGPAWTEPGAPLDPSKDARVAGFLYGLGVSPADDSVWYVLYSKIADGADALPGGLVRLERGADPPESCRVELFEPPIEHGRARAYNPRGVDLDSQGVAWVGFSSGQIGRFDRRRCKVLNGPRAAGQHCPEGWTFYDSPGPNLRNATEGSADYHYLAWVDQHDTLGLGKDVPIVPGTNSDSLLVVDPQAGGFRVLRVPYPMGFFARGLDGRIDDPKAGWKGRGVWSNYAEVAVHHIEGGVGTRGKVVKFQMRPHPLAK